MLRVGEKFEKYFHIPFENCVRRLFKSLWYNNPYTETITENPIEQLMFHCHQIFKLKGQRNWIALKNFCLFFNKIQCGLFELYRLY